MFLYINKINNVYYITNTFKLRHEHFNDDYKYVKYCTYVGSKTGIIML